MVNEWQTVELGEVASVRSGYAFKSNDWQASGIPVVKISNVKDGRLMLDGCSFVSKSKARESGEFQLQPGDILISMTGYVGEVARVRSADIPCVLNQRVGKFSVLDDQRLDADFLFIFLSFAETRRAVEALGYGSAQPNVSPTLIHKIKIALPPLHVQRDFAQIVSALDEKIELNRRMNVTLEAMARALFQSWFVDFDPVRRNADPSPLAPLPEGEGDKAGYRGGAGFVAQLEIVRQLRAQATPAEQVMWALLRDRRFMGAKFRRQHQFLQYVADFYCHEAKLAVELDGGVHTGRKDQDAERDHAFAEQGVTVLRFTNEELFSKAEQVLTTLGTAIHDRLPKTTDNYSPLPLGEGQGVREQQTDNTAYDHLFPSDFEESELGLIPRGWAVRRIGDVVECVGGGTPSTAESAYWEDGVHHWATPKDLSGLRSPMLLDTERRLTDAGVAKVSSGLLPAGTLLMSSRAPVGYLAIATMPVAINQGFIALKSSPQASSQFLLNWCRANMPEIEARATGTTFAEISKQNFRPILLVLPPQSVMTAFSAIVGQWYQRIEGNLREARTLSQARDLLLPRLLNGELSPSAALAVAESL